MRSRARLSLETEAEASERATRSLRRDHALLEDEATVKAPFASWHNGEGALGALVESEAFDAKKRHVLARRAIDGLLHFALHWRHGVRIADYFHAASRIRDERIEWHHRKDRLDRARRVDASQWDWLADHRGHCGRGRRGIGVDDDDLVAVSHPSQGVKQVRGEKRIDPPKHVYPPSAHAPVARRYRDSSGLANAGTLREARDNGPGCLESGGRA